jgi:hypothetical protein
MGVADGEKRPEGDGKHSNNNSFRNFTDVNASNTIPLDPKKVPSFAGDFIVISEFSEQVGPVPLYVIPEGTEGTFNLNAFVLKIMAVDFQNKTNDPQSYLKDSQVVMPEPNEDAIAYVCNTRKLVVILGVL